LHLIKHKVKKQKSLPGSHAIWFVKPVRRGMKNTLFLNSTLGWSLRPTNKNSLRLVASAAVDTNRAGTSLLKIFFKRHCGIFFKTSLRKFEARKLSAIQWFRTPKLG
jgi:hypothetical protein